MRKTTTSDPSFPSDGVTGQWHEVESTCFLTLEVTMSPEALEKAIFGWVKVLPSHASIKADGVVQGKLWFKASWKSARAHNTRDGGMIRKGDF